MMGELSRRKKLCRYFEMKALRQEKASAAGQREVIQYTRPLLNSLLTFIAEVESKEGCTQRVQPCQQKEIFINNA